MHPELPPQRERLLLLTLAGIQFSHILDFMIMMPLGPLLIGAFGIDPHAFGLLVASYSFSAAAAGVLAASFVDRFGRKRLLLGVLALFGLATLACALAPGYYALLVARGLAGAFGGVIGALVQTIVGDAVPYARRAKAGATVAAAFSVSTVAGVPFSLWLATWAGWRAPFVAIALLALFFIAVGARVMPDLRHHLSDREHAHPFADLFAVLADANHRRALAYSGMIIFSGFTVIPYITLYSVHNVGITQAQLPLVYLFGGAATFFTAQYIGRWADRRGKVEVYRRVAALATLPLLLVTHLPAAPLWGWLVCTTLFFVLVSGRMIPAMTIITSAAEPRRRGTFMSVNGTVQSLAMGLATTLAGFLISQPADGRLLGYNVVGYVAVVANLAAILFVSRLALRDRAPMPATPGA